MACVRKSWHSSRGSAEGTPHAPVRPIADHADRLQLALFSTQRAGAQAPQPPGDKPEMRENCPGLVASDVPRIIPAALRLALNPDQVRITYSGHATFLIESPQRRARSRPTTTTTSRPPVLPDIATMNHAHSTHFTDRPDPRIPHVLRGWGPSPDVPARHDLQVRDVRVRNVPTNIRDWATGGTERHGNSIFIFEMANMCIAHLGHLHHTLTQQQLDEIGRIDIVFAPVDGTLTLDTDGMFEVLRGLKAQVIIPMHFFSVVHAAPLSSIAPASRSGTSRRCRSRPR